MNQIVFRSRIRNRYNFGEKSIGQLFLKQTNSATDLQIRFTKESKWKIESITLLNEGYEQAASKGVGQLLRSANHDYFERGFASQHLMPLKFHFASSQVTEPGIIDSP